MSKSTHRIHKLTRGDAVDIRRAHAAGVGVAALAARHCVCKETVRSVLRYARYAPELSPEHHARLAAAAPRLGLTLDDALDLILVKGLHALETERPLQSGR